MWFGLSVGQKQMCQISGRGLIGGCQGVVYRAGCQFINNNGPAVEGVNVTRRSHPATDPGSLARKLSRWRGGYGAIFASLGERKIV